MSTTEQNAGNQSSEQPGPPNEVDVVVLGAGPVGENLAQYATQDSGLDALLVEAERFGGECSYWACMPSKALLRPMSVGAAANNVSGVSDTEVNTEGLFARRDTFTSHYDDAGQVKWAQKAGLLTTRGRGRLVGEREVEITESSGQSHRVRARHAVVLATGSEPVIPAPYRDVLPWTSRDATGVREVPERLVIVGGGVVACEAATWLAGMGAQVTMLVRGEALLAGQEAFAGKQAATALRRAGVSLEFGVEVSGCERPEARDTGVGLVHGGPVTLNTSNGQFTADEVLVATGRRPALSDLGLDAVGLSPDDVLNDQLPDWLYAVGDASGEAPLTHWGKYRARVIGQQIGARATGGHAELVPETVPVPQVVFTDPQVATVGLTEARARDEGYEVVTSEVPYGSSAGTALLRDDVTGRAKIIVDADDGVLLGATFVGPEAAELIHAGTVAIVAQMPVHLLRHVVAAYPTSSELWLPLVEGLPYSFRSVP